MWRVVSIVILVCGVASVGDGQGPRTREPVSVRAQRLVTRGESFMQSGDRGSAIGFFREAVQVDPRFGAAYAALGQAYLGRGDFERAMSVFGAGVERAPDHIPNWLGLAQGLERQGQGEEALAVLRRLVRGQPEAWDACLAYAELTRRSGRWVEALNAYRALGRLARAQGRTGAVAEAHRYEAALRVLSEPLDPVSARSVCLHPQSSWIRRALAGCETERP